MKTGTTLALVFLVVAVLLLTAFAVDLAAKINVLERQVIALVDLQEVQAETHQSLLAITENHSASINALNESTTGLLYVIEVYREDHVKSVAEIYQGHIIELRAFHMSPENYPYAFLPEMQATAHQDVLNLQRKVSELGTDFIRLQMRFMHCYLNDFDCALEGSDG